MSQPKVQVAGTNDYSIHSKASIVAAGLADDPFLVWFVGEQSMARVRRSPIINRGYYVRHRALEYAFRRVLLSNNSSSSKNIVLSLGAGFDTSALRYHHAVELFIELDYPAVCRRKAAILESRKAKLPFQGSSSAEEEIVFESGSTSNGPFIVSPRYLLLGVDLRQPEEVVKVLADKKVGEVLLKAATPNSSDINIILLNECSLCYIAQEEADALLARLISYLTEKLSANARNNSNNAHLSFTYLGYEMLASAANTEDYGRFLRRHFDAMGAGILSFLSEAEICERFLSSSKQQQPVFSFDQLEVINMKTFWREQLNSNCAERERLRALEPFDEFEELDSVCASYSLTIARKGGSSEAEVKDKSKTVEELLPSSEWEAESSSLLTPIGQHEHLLSVFGHCSHFDAEKNILRVFGGFGREPDGKATAAAGHRRLRPIVEFQLSSPQKKLNKSPKTPNVFTPRLLYPNSSQAINRVHAQVVHLGTNSEGTTTRYLLSGGRTSPAAIQQSALLEIDEHKAEYHLQPIPSMIQQQQVEHQSETVIAGQAFRHVCARFGARSEQVVQFGGITAGDTAPSRTVFLFDISSSFDVTVSTVRRLDTHRHSAAFTTLGDHCLLLNGGLELATDGFQSRFAPLELVDRREMVVNQLKLKKSLDGDNGGLPLLYGHRMQLISEYEVLVVGGIGEKRIENAAFRVDLRAPAVTAKYRLQCQPQSSSLLMLTNHTTAFTADGHRLCIIGGGGNCFSFGTHFNPLLEYDL